MLPIISINGHAIKLEQNKTKLEVVLSWFQVDQGKCISPTQCTTAVAVSTN